MVKKESLQNCFFPSAFFSLGKNTKLKEIRIIHILHISFRVKTNTHGSLSLFHKKNAHTFLSHTTHTHTFSLFNETQALYISFTTQSHCLPLFQHKHTNSVSLSFNTHPHTHTDRHRHTDTHIHTTDTYTQTHTHTQTPKYTQRQIIFKK